MMKLVSCEYCATVYDAQYLNFPEDIHKRDGYGGYEVDETKAAWRTGEYRPFATCRVCDGKLFQED